MTVLSQDYLPVNQITPADLNPKAHQLEQTKASIVRFGFAQPVVLDDRTGRVVAGHGRIEALQELQQVWAGWPEPERPEPPRGIQARADGMWLVPVTRGWRSKDDDEAHALGVALNKIGEGLWDRAGLAGLLDDLAGKGYDLAELGSSGDELDDMLSKLAPSKRAEPVLPPPEQERQVQGIREVPLTFSADQHREWSELVAILRRQWRIDAVPMLVLEALRRCEAAGRSSGDQVAANPSPR